ncbi:MAG: hypothetical protein FWH12_09390 [Treponema sp.]|nr:hypothetical protein [Treponema sp.]
MRVQGPGGEITPKENYRLLYERKLPHWLPVFGERQFLSPRLDPDNLARCFCFEAQGLTMEEYRHAAQEGYRDKFGIRWIYVPQAGGSMVYPGSPTLSNANDWKSVIEFPDIGAWDWEASRAANAEYTDTDKCLTALIMNGLFERLISWMDFEGAAIALIDDEQKDSVHQIFDALAVLYMQMIDRYIEVYGIDQISFHDDWGGQYAPLFSLAVAEEMLVPHLKKIVDHCHSRGIFFDMHSCGKNEILVPAYIAAGCDSWSGQTMNDKKMLYQLYGDKIILGIEPDLDHPGQENPRALAKSFIDTYCGEAFLKRPILAGMSWGLPLEFTATLFEESRRAFSDLSRRLSENA